MLQFSSVRKSFGKKNILNDISFHVYPGERVGLVGPNGAGKSTIFKILIGKLSVDKGDFSIRKGMRLGHMRQQIEEGDKESSILDYTCKAIPELDEINTRIHKIEDKLAAGLDGNEQEKLLNQLGDLQEQFEELGGYEIQYRAETALSGLGFKVSDFKRPMKEFSGGWQMRAELARVLISIPNILLLDEPTNYLDVPAIEWLQEYLKSFQGTMLLISHDRYLLNLLTSVTIEIFQGNATRYTGNYDKYVKDREERNLHLDAAFRNQQEKKEKLESFINRFKAKATKASQAKSRMKELEKMEEIEAPVQSVKGARIVLKEPPRCSPILTELIGMGKSYDKKHWIYKDISIEIQNGEKIGIVGTNGMGKTTLMRILAGTLPFEEGKRRQGHNVLIGYHSQDYTETMAPDMTVYEVSKAAGPGVPEKEIRSLLGNFGFHGDDVLKHVQVLSGGEKVRLSLAKLLLNPPNFLLLDEPTTHLDIQSREALQEALKEFKGTVCLVSHDIEFLRAVSEQIFEVSEKGLTKYFGDYNYYRSKIKELAEAEKAENLSGNKPAPRPVQKVEEVAKTEPVTSETSEEKKERKRREAEARQQLSKKKGPLEKKISELEKKIEELEAEEEALVARFSEELSGDEFKKVNSSLMETAHKKGDLEIEWELASTELEELLEKFGGSSDS